MLPQVVASESQEGFPSASMRLREVVWRQGFNLVRGIHLDFADGRGELFLGLAAVHVRAGERLQNNPKELTC